MLSTHGLNADSLVLIENRSEVELRAAALQTKLTALGVNDITQEGSLVLAGTADRADAGAHARLAVVLRSRSTPRPSSISTRSAELFEYTHAGGAAVPRRLDSRRAGRARAAGARAGPAQDADPRRAADDARRDDDDSRRDAHPRRGRPPRPGRSTSAPR